MERAFCSCHVPANSAALMKANIGVIAYKPKSVCVNNLSGDLTAP